MKQNIELDKIREFGDIISDTFVLIRQNFKPLLKAYFTICGVFMIGGILASIMYHTQHVYGDTPSLFSFAGTLSFLFGILNHTALVLTVICYFILYKEKGNQPPNIIEVWGYFRYYSLRVLGTQFILILAMCISALFCVVPAIYLFPIVSLVIPIMVIENANVEYSIKKAYHILKGDWWLTFGVLLLLAVIVLAAFAVIFTPPAIFWGVSQWLTGRALDTSFIIIRSIIFQACEVLGILPIIGITLVYYTLTEQKESNSLINRIQMFGKSNSGADEHQSEQY
ncbi:hypothetical protein [Mucilaginibacter paludis]|uniref:Glycerophosphoryl diester phosphodiesterase membrane domain-containing protein n=1 Tax=Mucilaginibacter paludis DSM 18603 TaxID=714943 RepID=H1Y4X9_9SPHI|nr:hypothetical protein [Mucilaginibacter paludis]EHQ28307.1 hypothetical protein Mucpa_4216 [Mucilaginibacter paludis DSM 18603]